MADTQLSSLSAASALTGTELFYSDDGAADVKVTATQLWALPSAATLGWNSDVLLARDAAAILAQRNSTTAQTLRVYNTYTDSSNYERAVFDWTTTANTLTIGAQAAGTGTLRALEFVGSTASFNMTKVDVSNNAAAGAYLRILGNGGNNWMLGVGTGSGITSAAINQPGININAGTNPIAVASQNTATLAIDPNNTQIQFGTAANSMDVALARSAAGVLEVNSTTVGTFRDILARGLRSSAVAFASAIGSPVEGTIQAFTDSSTATWGATITGGGANHVLGYFNGTNWTVMAA